TMANYTYAFRGKHFGTDASLLTVTFGPVGDPVRFHCGVTAFNVANQEIACATGYAVGSNLVFQVKANKQTSAQGTDSITFAAPVISNHTLRLTGGSKTDKLFTTNTEGELIEFDGLHFGVDASLLTVAYGPAGGAKTYPCTQVKILVA